ncbi:MAG: type II secretion system GspH family protein [Phycisphaerales bacterium]|nr:type II secretion system GspH family protein [Phycisphaerales bacterium]
MMSLRRRDIPNRPLGFTMTELLVTMGILIILVSILVVTVGGVRETARVATTRSLMTAMSQATSRFREDVGYLPPILDNDRGLMPPVPITSTVRPNGGEPNYLYDMQGWYSYTSPAEYLVGYGNSAEDGLGGGPNGTLDSPGIRSPGIDGVWGATRDNGSGNWDPCNSTLANRRPATDGKVFGPYLELKNEDTLGSLGWDDDNNAWNTGSIDPTTDQPAVYFPGDPGYDRNAPKVLVDAWGSPIRYYRLNYPSGTLDGRYPANYQVFPRSSEWRYTPKLSEFIALRPWEIAPENATDYGFVPGGGSASRWGDFNELGAGSNGDTTTTAALQSGEFAFLSAGPDRRIFNWHRTDYPDQGGNDGASFQDWVGHFPNRAADDAWFPDGNGSHCRAEPWYTVSVTEEVNRDNIREIGP